MDGYWVLPRKSARRPPNDFRGKIGLIASNPTTLNSGSDVMLEKDCNETRSENVESTSERLSVVDSQLISARVKEI